MTGSVDADLAEVVVVLAKQPRPGRSKTRLQTRFSPAGAAELAAACLRDTLTAVRACRVPRRVLAWEGDASGYDDGFEVVPQPSGTLNDRLVAAFRAARARSSYAAGVLLIGMDTPQVTPAQLEVDWQGADAVLGLSEDGGFWVLGLREVVDPAPVFADIAMSTDATGAAQLARLHALGLSVRLLPPLRDVDTPADAAAVAAAHPGLGFSARYRELLTGAAVG